MKKKSLVSSSTKTFGQRLRAARIKCGLTQLQLATEVQRITGTPTSKGNVSRWETGSIQHPRSETLLAITAVTRRNQHWLLSGSGKEMVELPQLKIASKDDATRNALRRAYRVAQSVHRESEAIEDALVVLFETLLDERDVPESVLRKMAEMAHPK